MRNKLSSVPLKGGRRDGCRNTSGGGSRLYPGRELGQWRQCRLLCPEREQRPVEPEHEHRFALLQQSLQAAHPDRLLLPQGGRTEPEGMLAQSPDMHGLHPAAAPGRC